MLDLSRKSFFKVCGYVVTAVCATLMTGFWEAEAVYGLWFQHPNPEEVYESWDRVPARVNEYRVVGRLGYHRTNRTTVRDRLLVRYTYVVKGRLYESENPGWYASSDVHTLDHLGWRETVDCYVNPQDPAEAVLFCNTADRPRWFARSMLCFFTFWFGAALYGLWVSVREFIRRLLRLPESVRRRSRSAYERARQFALACEARQKSRRK